MKSVRSLFALTLAAFLASSALAQILWRVVPLTQDRNC